MAGVTTTRTNIGSRGDDGDLARAEAPSSRATPAGRAVCVPAMTKMAANSSETRSAKAAALAPGVRLAHAAWRWSRMISANSEGSILPPDSTAATVLPSNRQLLARGSPPATPRRPAPARASARGTRSAPRRVASSSVTRDAAGQIALGHLERQLARRHRHQRVADGARQRRVALALALAAASARGRRSPPARRCRSAVAGSSP